MIVTLEPAAGRQMALPPMLLTCHSAQAFFSHGSLRELLQMLGDSIYLALCNILYLTSTMSLANNDRCPDW